MHNVAMEQISRSAERISSLSYGNCYVLVVVVSLEVMLVSSSCRRARSSVVISHTLKACSRPGVAKTQHSTHFCRWSHLLIMIVEQSCLRYCKRNLNKQ